MLSADPEREPRNALLGAVDPEDLMDHAVLEGGSLVGEQDGDGSKGHKEHDVTVGRILARGVLSATSGGILTSAQLLP